MNWVVVVLPEIHDPNLVTFMSLKKRIFELMITALTIETDSTNTQLLLGMLVWLKVENIVDDLI